MGLSASKKKKSKEISYSLLTLLILKEFLPHDIVYCIISKVKTLKSIDEQYYEYNKIVTNSVNDAKQFGWKEIDGIMVPPKRLEHLKQDKRFHKHVDENGKELEIPESMFDKNLRRYGTRDIYNAQQQLRMGGMIY